MNRGSYPACLSDRAHGKVGVTVVHVHCVHLCLCIMSLCNFCSTLANT